MSNNEGDKSSVSNFVVVKVVPSISIRASSDSSSS